MTHDAQSLICLALPIDFLLFQNDVPSPELHSKLDLAYQRIFSGDLCSWHELRHTEEQSDLADLAQSYICPLADGDV